MSNRSLRAACALAVLPLFIAPAYAAMASKTIDLIDAEGKIVGSAELTDVQEGVLIEAQLTGIEPGTHGFHLHETGICEATDGFESAGGHIAGDKMHGYRVDGGPHPGDMPNIHVPSSGELTVEVLNTHVVLSSEDATDEQFALYDDRGSALMIHSGADDYESQPSGDAGTRIACGVIRGKLVSDPPAVEVQDIETE